MTQPAEMRVTAAIQPDGYTQVVIDGVPHTRQVGGLDEARHQVVAIVREAAAGPSGLPVTVDVDDPQGPIRLVVHPDGSVLEQPLAREAVAATASEDTIPPGQLPALREEAAAETANVWGPPDERRAAAPQPSETGPAQEQPQPSAPQPFAPDPAQASVAWMRNAAGSPPRAPQQPVQRVQPVQQPPVPQQPSAIAPQPQPGWPTTEPAPMTRRQMRESFLRTEQVEQPAATGFRGALSKIGIRTQPSQAEREQRDDVHAVSQHWPGVRTIAVVNGKGGAGKSPCTALLAATFARYSGAATVAWDNNETRGTLGWRTEQGKHENTVLDLIPRTAELLDPSARAGDISHYVHHQAADKYDVLRSNPHLISAEQRIGADDVDAIHDVLGRYYRLIFVDSGNDESASHWLRMIDKADQLVVPTIARPEHAEAGALLLEELVRRGGRSEELARRAVVVVSQAREKDAHPSAAEIARGFAGWTSAVVTIPYDRAMVESVLHFDALAPATRRAWLRAAAAVARQL